ncbi:MAG: hypothetical protein HY517_03745 [Candidatus Aenigmarchaeota archaeon]|nr:hypothetical protein [Candidatus Aenigmarchaeota archaeon]
MAEDRRDVKRVPFEIKVEGNLGLYTQIGHAEIGPEDIVNALRAYFVRLHDKRNPACPDPVAEGRLTLEIRYPTRT